MNFLCATKNTLTVPQRDNTILTSLKLMLLLLSQSLLHIATRMILLKPKIDPVTPLQKALQWLPGPSKKKPNLNNGRLDPMLLLPPHLRDPISSYSLPHSVPAAWPHLCFPHTPTLFPCWRPCLLFLPADKHIICSLYSLPWLLLNKRAPHPSSPPHILLNFSLYYHS